MEVTNQKLFEASRAENHKLLADIREASKETNRAETRKLFEASRAENQKLLAEVQEASRTDNQKLLAEVQEASRAENQKLQAAILTKIGKELKATSGKLQEIHESISKRITGVEERGVALRKDR